MSIKSKYITDYIDFVESGKVNVCERQKKLINLVKNVFATEKLHVDEEQAAKYFSYQKYFPYRLLPWEVFCFTLHNCVYKENGQLRFPTLVVYVARGAGKNGYLAFEDFCLITETNGVKNYDIDIFAMSEEQAMQSFKDIYNILEDNKQKMKSHFSWNKEVITNRKTNSSIRYRTSNAKTKDGARPGKVDFDEYHAYLDSKLITVATTGLGKIPFPRKTITTTDGNVREGVLDQQIEKCDRILNGEIADNGTLPFLCSLDSDDEIDNPDMWVKANPSLIPEFSNYDSMMQEILSEYADYKENPIVNADFPTKRMNRPQTATEGCIVDFEYIKATNKPIPEKLLQGKPCVAGIDFMKSTDFLSAGLLYLIDDEYIFVHHTWVCSQSADLSRIKAPIREWEALGWLTFIDGPEIPADVPICWLLTEAEKRGSQILKIGMDLFRHTYVQKALDEYGYIAKRKDEESTVRLIRPSDEMKQIPLITSGFINKKFTWGDDPCLRWCANNTKIEQRGINTVYGKIEEKSRKTDTFKAFVAAFCCSDILEQQGNFTADMFQPMIF